MDKIAVRQSAQIIWDYHHLNQKLEKADVLLVLGSHDLRVAERAAELFLQGYAPLVVFSGQVGKLTKDLWSEPEADKFTAVAIKLGVPPASIIIENKSVNTGENIIFSRKLLAERGIDPQRVLLVQKPYMERRAYATFKQYWPEKEVRTTSTQISFADYPSPEISEDEVINIMVGDLQRIKIYPSRGYMVAQEIPDEVWRAYEKLVAAGYTKYLIKD